MERDLQKLRTALAEAETHRTVTARADDQACAAVRLARIKLAATALADCRLWHVIDGIRSAIEELERWERDNPQGEPWFLRRCEVFNGLNMALSAIVEAGEDRSHALTTPTGREGK